MTRKELKRILDMDLKANGMAAWKLGDRFRRPEVQYLRTLRRVEYRLKRRGWMNRAARFVLRYRLMRLSTETGISLPTGVAEPGLGIAHYGNIVVNSKSRIGAGTRINSGVNVGIHRGGAPSIGRRVYISPGAVLYGPITIGDGSVIGANSVVGRDVPPGVTVAGSPARKISDRDSSEIMPDFFP